MVVGRPIQNPRPVALMARWWIGELGRMTVRPVLISCVACEEVMGLARVVVRRVVRVMRAVCILVELLVLLGLRLEYSVMGMFEVWLLMVRSWKDNRGACFYISLRLVI